MNSLDKQYQDLLQTILDYGVEKKDRTGTGTKSIFGYTIRHNMSEGFPVLTTKKMAWKTMVTELLWFLRGDTNIKYLVDNDCHIWDGDCFANYIKHNPNTDEQMISDASQMVNIKEWFINKIKTDDEFAKKWGELGPIYGKQWRSWGRSNVTNYDLKDVTGADQYKIIKAIENGEDVTKYGVKIEYQNNSIDQIANLIRDLKTNPDSRRIIVSAWNVAEIDQMTLPPCHNFFQFYTRELSNEEIAFEANKVGFNLKGMTISGKLIINPKEVKEHNLPTRAISLTWNQRSVDTFLGLPFNIASYGLLLEIIAKEVNMVPEELIGNLGDTHLYSNHIEQANEQIGREPYELPKLVINDEFWNPDAGLLEQIEYIEIYDFEFRDYQSHSGIKAKLSN